MNAEILQQLNLNIVNWILTEKYNLDFEDFQPFHSSFHLGSFAAAGRGEDVQAGGAAGGGQEAATVNLPQRRPRLQHSFKVKSQGFLRC